VDVPPQSVIDTETSNVFAIALFFSGRECGFVPAATLGRRFLHGGPNRPPEDRSPGRREDSRGRKSVENTDFSGLLEWDGFSDSGD
jgi:hypothetical protein